MNFIIRPADIHDHKQIAKISIAGWRQAYNEILPDNFLQSLDWRQRMYGRVKFIANPKHCSFVAENNSIVIGFCDIGPAHGCDNIPEIDNMYGEIYAIYVLEDYQKHGVGKQLLARSIEYFKRHDYSSIVIWSLSQNKAAQSFYSSCGFKSRSWDKNFVLENIEYPEVAQVLSLSEYS